MDLYSKPGTKIVFTGIGGYPNQNLYAQERLIIGRVYTVKLVEVYDFASFVRLEEEDGHFNTVMFEAANGIKRAVEIIRETNNE